MSAVSKLEVFHEVGPDEQNARGPVEAVSDLGTKSLLSSQQQSCVRPHKVNRRTHAIRKTIRAKGVENDASARPPNLSLASCDLDLGHFASEFF